MENKGRHVTVMLDDCGRVLDVNGLASGERVEIDASGMMTLVRGEAKAPPDAVIANGTDLQIDDSGDLIAATLASIDRVLAEEPRPGAIQIVDARTGRRADRMFVDDPDGPPPCRKCPLCFVDLTPLTSYQHSILYPTETQVVITCTAERCKAWVQRVQEQADAMRRRLMEVDTSGVPIGKAPQCGHQALTDGCSVCAILRDRLLRADVELRARIAWSPADADRLRGEFGLPEPEDGDAPTVEIAGFAPTPPPRADGFSQAQVDAAKAVLLAPAAKRGTK